jgi:hypothetical protein
MLESAGTMGLKNTTLVRNIVSNETSEIYASRVEAGRVTTSSSVLPRTDVVAAISSNFGGGIPRALTTSFADVPSSDAPSASYPKTSLIPSVRFNSNFIKTTQSNTQGIQIYL